MKRTMEWAMERVMERNQNIEHLFLFIRKEGAGSKSPSRFLFRFQESPLDKSKQLQHQPHGEHGDHNEDDRPHDGGAFLREHARA
jgi:hypothetical protein